MTDQIAPAAEEWTAQQIEEAERIAASHHLGHLTGPEACYYAFVSEAFWHRGELASRDGIDPYWNVSDDDVPHASLLLGSMHQGEAYAVVIFSPNHCDMSPEYHAWRARLAAENAARTAEGDDEPPF